MVERKKIANWDGETGPGSPQSRPVRFPSRLYSPSFFPLYESLERATKTRSSPWQNDTRVDQFLSCCCFCCCLYPRAVQRCRPSSPYQSGTALQQLGGDDFTCVTIAYAHMGHVNFTSQCFAQRYFPLRSTRNKLTITNLVPRLF